MHRHHPSDIVVNNSGGDAEGKQAVAQTAHRHIRERGSTPDALGDAGPRVGANGWSTCSSARWGRIEAYQVSCPIYYREGLEDPLLLVHSIIDDNVRFQDAARLVQRLIELEREFEVMFYPLERHNFAHVASRLDYYRRVAELFEGELLR